MPPDKRLNQLEPILGEAVAQLKRANNNITTLIEINTRQSNDISFLLRGQANQQEQLAEVKTRLDGFEQTLTAILNAVQRPSGN